MPVIEVKMWEGRTTEQKEELIKRLTDAIVETCGTKKGHVSVIIHDVKKENWGLHGEQASKIR